MKSQGIGMKMVRSLSAATLAVVASMPGTAVAGHTTVGLGTADSFAILGGSAVSNTGPTVVNGDLGLSPGTVSPTSAITGFPPGIVVNGTIHDEDAVAAQAQADLTTAYNSAAGRACNTVLTGKDLGGLTLTAAVYCYASSAQLTGDVTLDAQGDPNAVFIFQIGSTLITASDSNVILVNSAQACNVFWQVGSSATLGTDTRFQGNILALTSITANTGSNVQDGRLLARNGAVTLQTNMITRPTCSHPATQTTPPGGGAPTGGTTTGGTTTGGTTTGGTTTGGTTAGTGGTTSGGTTAAGSDTTSGRQDSGETPDSNLPRTGERYPTAQTLALATFMILTGFLYNFLGSSSSPLALRIRGYQPKRRAHRWRRV